MTNNFLSLFKDGVQYLRKHPQLLFTIFLLVLIPLAFNFTAQQFLTASKENQERLERDKIGLMHDMFMGFVVISGANRDIVQTEIDEIARANPDILAFRLSEKTDNGFVPVSAFHRDVIDLVEKDATVYNFAYINPDESFIEYIYVDSHRALRGVRLVKVGEKDYVLLTISSLATTDSLFADRIRVAYFWLVVVLAVVLFMVFRHVRLIDYGYLYQRS